MSIKKIILKQMKESILSVKNENWDEARTQIIHNLYNIEDFDKIIENFIPCNKKLYISKEIIEKKIEDYLFRLEQFFIKDSHGTIIPKENIYEDEITEIINLGTEIIIHKQEDEYYCLNFTICHCPSTIYINNKEIEQLEKFIKIDKYKNNHPFQISIDHSIYGLEVYKYMISNPNNCIYTSIGNNGCYSQVFSLYKSNNGSIYLLEISCFEYVVSYILIENKKWFDRYIPENFRNISIQS